MPSSPDADVYSELFDLIDTYQKRNEPSAIDILALFERIMKDDEDGPELVRLFQKWLACI